MRNYRNGFSDLAESTCVYVGICKSLSFEHDNYDKALSLKGLANSYKALANKLELDIVINADVKRIAICSQDIIDFIIKHNKVSMENLKTHIDKELNKLPKNPFINYFE